MPETRTSALAIREQQSRVVGSVLQSSGSVLGRVGQWAGDTAQQFGSLVSALMAPAVFSAYALAVWSLAANLGWTSTFMFSTGPLSNWLVWSGIAILVHMAANILRRHTQMAASESR